MRSAGDAPKGEGQQDFGIAGGQVNDCEQKADRAEVAWERRGRTPHPVRDLVRVHAQVERGQAVAQNALSPQAQVVVGPSNERQE